MSDSNRVRVALFKDPTPTVALSSQRMRVMRDTGESKRYAPIVTNSKERRSDRMSQDPILANTVHDGGLKMELSFPPEGSAHSILWEALLFNTWTNAPFRDNDGVAASAITSVTTGTNIIAITTGSTIQAGHLVRNTGFGLAANNGVFRCTTASNTAPAFSGAAFATEASPAATARMKVVGLQGVAADIAATATGLTSAALNWATLGLVPGMWIKIGGSAVGNQFANAANNGRARVAAIPAAGTLTLDNLPAGWAVDAGTGKTISIFFGDRLINGTNQIQFGVERTFLDHSPNTVILQRGFSANQLTLNFPSEDVINGEFSSMGMRGSDGTTANGASYDAAPDSGTYPVYASNAHISRLAEGGAVVAAPNFVESATITINNNVRALKAIGQIGAAALGAGSIDVSVKLNTYFGDRTLLAKLFAQTPTSFSSWIQSALASGNNAMVFTLPRLFFTNGQPNATAINTDVMLPIDGTTSRDPVTNCEIDLQRFEYLE